jgi:hypothetical protein
MTGSAVVGPGAIGATFAAAERAGQAGVVNIARLQHRAFARTFLTRA